MAGRRVWDGFRRNLGLIAAVAALAVLAIAITIAGVLLNPPAWIIIAVPVLGAAGAWFATSAYRQWMEQRQETADETPQHRRGRLLSTLAVLSFAAGTFTWRGRTAADLSSAPVDAAAGVRIVADALAIALVFLALTVKDRPRAGRSAPRTLYLLYIVVVVLGAFMAVDPQLVLFRVFDLAVAFAVAVTATVWQTLQQLIRLCRRILLGIAGVIFVEAALLPSLALSSARGGLVPFRLEGVFPIITYNSVGAFGVMLVALGIGSAEARRLTVTAGLVLVLLSQYRTGYLAVAAIVVVYLIANRGALYKTALVALIPLGFFVVQSSVFQDAWTRGEEASNSVATLSGRTDYWAAAIQVARRSPIIGTGLSSGTRFEAFPLIGNDTASTIHGTWIEAYLGTGFVGTGILAAFVVASLVGAWRIRATSQAPLLLIVSVLVRSATGTTIELAQISLVFVLVLAIKASQLSAAAAEEQEPAVEPSPPPVPVFPVARQGGGVTPPPG